MKTTLLHTLILLFTVSIFKLTICYAQNDKDPFMGNYVLGNSAELFMLYSHNSTNSPYPYLFDFDQDNFSITNTPLHDHELFDNQYFDLCTGDFNGDGFDDAVEATVDNNSNLYLQISGKWETYNVGLHSSYDPNIRLVSGDLDGDAEKEFVLAYWNADNNIHINLYDLDSAKVINQLASARWALEPSLGNEALFDISVGDFDDDGYDEIVVVKNNASIPDHDSLFVANIDLDIRIYDFDPDNGLLNLLTEKNIKRKHVFNWWDAPWPGWNRYHSHVRELMKLSIAAGNLSSNNFDEFIVGYSIRNDYLNRI